MPQDVSAAFTGQGEIAVLREVHRRRLVGRRRVVHDQLVGRGERVGDVGHEGAGVPFLAVGAQVAESDTDGVAVLERLGLPHDLVEPAQAAVQVVRSVVGRELVGLAVQGESPLGDAVGVPPDDRAEKGRRLEVAVEGIESERHVARAASLVRHPNRLDDRAVGDGADLHPVGVGECVAVHAPSVWHPAERRSRHGRSLLVGSRRRPPVTLV